MAEIEIAMDVEMKINKNTTIENTRRSQESGKRKERLEKKKKFKSEKNTYIQGKLISH